MPRKFTEILQMRFATPLMLGMICLLSYGLLVVGAGYYGDDLSIVWLGYKSHQMGVFFAGNRPILGGFLDLLTRIIGPAPWQWHLFALVWRWICTVAFWKLLDSLWPDRKVMTAAAGMLFSVYPGFYLSGEATQFSPYYLQFAALAGSMLATVQSLRHPKKRVLWSTLALAGSIFNFLVSEYFYFLELLRWLIIWYELSGQSSAWQRFRRTMAHALPYGFVFIGFFTARLFGLGNAASSYKVTLINKFLANPFLEYQALWTKIGEDIWRVTLGSFLRASTLPGLETRSNLMIVAFLIFMVVVAGLCYWFLRGTAQRDHPDNLAHLRIASDWILLGLSALIISGWPIWVSGLQVFKDFNASRFTLPFIPGACLLMVGLVELMGVRYLRWGALAALVAAAVGFQVLNSYDFIQHKQNQAEFLLQMSTRMPVVKPGTLFILNEIPLEFNSENSNSALINLFYTPGAGQLELRYYVYQQNMRNQKILELRTQPSGVTEKHMIGSFTRQYIINAIYHSPNCFRILDPDLDPLNSNLPIEQRKTASLTNFDAIQPQPEGSAQVRPSEIIYGKQTHLDDWCSSFEQASLAAQFENWSQVAAIGDRALSRGWMGKDPMELVVFIEGFAHQQDWARVSELSNQAIRLRPGYEAVFCRFKARIQTNTPPAEEREEALSKIVCPPN